MLQGCVRRELVQIESMLNEFELRLKAETLN